MLSHGLAVLSCPWNMKGFPDLLGESSDILRLGRGSRVGVGFLGGGLVP